VRERTATDLGLDMASFADHRQPDHDPDDDGPREIARRRLEWRPECGWIYLAGLNAWDASDHFARHLKVGPCPVCEDRPMRRSAYCLGCDRTGLDDRRSFPGLAVDEAPNLEYHGENQPSYQPGPLAGGKGRRRKLA
jgi:hypothetical protein